MKNSAIERIAPYGVGSDAANACTTLEQYIDLLKSVFQPPSESRSLKQEFKMAKQSKNEDVSSYLSSKLSLYDSIFHTEIHTYTLVFAGKIDDICPFSAFLRHIWNKKIN